MIRRRGPRVRSKAQGRPRAAVLLIALTLSLLTDFAAAAQPGPPPSEPEWSAPEIVVTAASPPMWKLRKAGSTVWVLGIIEPLPAGMRWNTAPVSRVLKEAKHVVLPPKTSVGLFQAISALSRAHLPRDTTLDQVLGPETSAAYAAVVERLGESPAKHQREKPAWAALMLELDLDHAQGYNLGEPLTTIRRLAQENHVPVSEADYRSGAMLDQLVALPEEEGRAAMQDAIAGADFALSHQRSAADAWASGRLEALRANISPAASASGLLLRTPAYKANAARSVEDTIEVIHQALDTPGTTLVLLTLTSLVRQGGALDRLRAEGVEITAPAA